MQSFTDYDFEIDVEGIHIHGDAHFNYTTEMHFSADVGGRDGPGVDLCDFDSVSLNGRKITRPTLVLMLGEKPVEEAEIVASDRIDELLKSGDLCDTLMAAE